MSVDTPVIALGDVIYRFELLPALRFEYISASAEELLGLDAQECANHPTTALHALFSDGITELHAAIANAGAQRDSQAEGLLLFDLPPVLSRWETPGRAPIFAEHHLRATVDESGTVVSVEGVARDMTERLRAEAAVAESEQRYSSLFQNSHAVMLIIDPADGSIVDVNPSACAFYGRSREAFLQMKISDVNTLTPEALRAEMDAALAQARNHFLFRHRMASGEIRDVEVYSSPAVINGRPLLYSIVHDVTARMRAESSVRQLAAESSLLLEATEVLTSSLDLDEMLRRLSGVAAGLVSARRCTIALQGDDGMWRDAASTDGRVKIPGAPFNPRMSKTGNVILLEDVQRLNDLELPLQPEMLSAMVVPLVRASVTGWLCFDDPGWPTIFSSEQRRLAIALGRQAALALANAQAYETQLSIAGALQRSMMPLPERDCCGMDIAHKYVSATKGAMVGGDFFDYMVIDSDRALLFIADVSGHGLEAAMHTAMAKYAVKALASIYSSPAKLLQAANKAIATQLSHGKFITMAVVLVDSRALSACAASAGHPNPLVVRGEGADTVVLALSQEAQNGPPLGALESSEYLEVCTALEPGDRIVLFTDGSTEARSREDRTRMYGSQGLREALMSHPGGSSAETAAHLLHRIEEFAGGSLSDDLAILVGRLGTEKEC